MAELVASMVVGPLVSLVKEKASSYLLDQYKVMEGMEEQHKILKRKLPAILDVISDAEQQASHREGAKAWLQELKTVAYEANEVFDEFNYEALRRQAKKKGMGNKLCRIVQTIEVLVAEMNAFGFKYQPQAPASKQWRDTDSIIVDPDNIVSRSRNEERKNIVKILVSDQAKNGDLMVFPIVGMGGLGKTTLAQLIYNDTEVQEYFQLLKWVCVSDEFDVHLLANKICNASENNLEKALQKLQQELNGKRATTKKLELEKPLELSSLKSLFKLEPDLSLVNSNEPSLRLVKPYLLVLDDVWNEEVDKWEKLKACLQHGGIGSVVLTTTRSKRIAEFMGAGKYHDITILGKEFLMEIIEKRAFSLQKQKPAELVNLVDRIAERCAGSPLAARALGSVLRNKSTVEEWEQCLKDYEIDVDMLIQLWMANGFISEQKGVTIETVGKRIFTEMVSRSFFQDVKEVTVDEDQRREGYFSRTICKIHDLMHDIAVSAMETECVALVEEPNPSDEKLPNIARHVYFSSVVQVWIILKHSLKKQPLAVQTMLFDGHTMTFLKHLSIYNSLRALKFPAWNLSIRPKLLRHLRYLDLQDSNIKALPEDISILYNLQVLNLSGCNRLDRLPKQMKYMASLRHLYTHGCRSLKYMPPDLGLLNLQTLTYFVVDSGSHRSSLGELKGLNIGGSLLIRQLEHVSEADAKAANLGKKKELRELSLRWTSVEEQQCHKVLEGLEAHDGLEALMIDSYQGTTFPRWMGMLQQMVELRLFYCTKADKLPPLCQLPELRLLHLQGLETLQCLCNTSSAFQKLKELKLVNLANFDRWWEVNCVQGELITFPQLQKLVIKCCIKVTELPYAAKLRESDGGEDNTMARSAFPELKEIELKQLRSFQRWEADPGIREQLIFPLLETVHVEECPQLTTLPAAPKLRVLEMSKGNQQMSLWAARYMASLSTLKLEVQDGETTLPAEQNSVIEMVDGKEKWNHISPLIDLVLDGSYNLYSSAIELWTCFVQLQELKISRCDVLLYWPENVFQSLVSLRSLTISGCNSLNGYAQPPDQLTSERSQLLPHLESLRIECCASLVEVFHLPASLKAVYISDCPVLESIFNKQQDKLELLRAVGAPVCP
ncbi:hypothetical protein ACP70R_037601 [Stipagrostis hirtigluma subsp. patula]